MKLVLGLLKTETNQSAQLKSAFCLHGELALLSKSLPTRCVTGTITIMSPFTFEVCGVLNGSMHELNLDARKRLSTKPAKQLESTVCMWSRMAIVTETRSIGTAMQMSKTINILFFLNLNIQCPTSNN